MCWLCEVDIQHKHIEFRFSGLREKKMADVCTFSFSMCDPICTDIDSNGRTYSHYAFSFRHLTSHLFHAAHAGL